jgi:hypothetical protein
MLHNATDLGTKKHEKARKSTKKSQKRIVTHIAVNVEIHINIIAFTIVTNPNVVDHRRQKKK